jgi:hypothetical protein
VEGCGHYGEWCLEEGCCHYRKYYRRLCMGVGRVTKKEWYLEVGCVAIGSGFWSLVGSL